MEFAVWAYPWDVLAEGVDRALDAIAALNLDGLSVATAYHAARTLSPRGPGPRIRCLEEGRVSFQPTAGRYKPASPLSPAPSPLYQREDPLRRITEAAVARGLAVHAWVVLTHNSRLGSAHPTLTLENAFGDRYIYALCPAQPTVVLYAAALCGDLARRYPLASIELESAGFMGFAHESHHDKIGVRIDRLREVCLSLCFCTACRADIVREGGDPEALAARVRAELEAYFARDGIEEPEDDAHIWARLGEILGDEGRDILFRARQTALLKMLQAIRAEVGEATSITVMATDSPLATGAVAGLPLAEAARWMDGVLLLDYTAPREQLAAAIRRCRATVGDAKALGTGINLLWPGAKDLASSQARAVHLAEAGLDFLRFYNYGLLTQPRLKWLGEIVEAVRRAGAV